jgi:hypothetical protein
VIAIEVFLAILVAIQVLIILWAMWQALTE